MSRGTAFLLLAAALAASVALAAADSVLELDPETFDDVVLKHDGAKLVEFYAPWLGMGGGWRDREERAARERERERERERGQRGS